MVHTLVYLQVSLIRTSRSEYVLTWRYFFPQVGRRICRKVQRGSKIEVSSNKHTRKVRDQSISILFYCIPIFNTLLNFSIQFILRCFHWFAGRLNKLQKSEHGECLPKDMEHLESQRTCSFWNKYDEILSCMSTLFTHHWVKARQGLAACGKNDDYIAEILRKILQVCLVKYLEE